MQDIDMESQNVNQNNMTREQEFTAATIKFVRELEADGWFGAGLEHELDEQVQDVIYMVLYKDRKSTNRVKKRLGSNPKDL